MNTPKPGAHMQSGVDPEQLRREVESILQQPAPTPEARASQFERAHAVLHDALDSNRN